MRHLVLAGLFALGLAAVSQPAFACASPDEPPPAEQVQRNSGTNDDCAVDGAPSLAHVKLDQTLKNQASRDHQIGLMGQRRYKLVAACDDACTGIGLEVVDVASGQSLGKSEGGGQTAVEFDVPASSQIRAIARMDNCGKENGCRYGVGVYTVGQLNKPKTRG